MAARSVHITRFQKTWLGSALAVGAIAACLVSGFLFEHLRCVRSTQLSPLGFIGGCLCIGLCNASLPWIFAGLVLTGFCCGLVSLAVPVFVAETSPPQVHGLLVSGVQLAIKMGALADFVGGKWLYWLALALLRTVGAVLTAVSMAFAVGSPSWLVTYGRLDEVLYALRFLYGPRFCAGSECLIYGDSLLRQPAAVGHLLQPSFSLPLAYTLLLVFVDHFRGTNIITLCAAKTLERYGSVTSAAGCTIRLGVVEVMSLHTYVHVLVCIFVSRAQPARFLLCGRFIVARLGGQSRRAGPWRARHGQSPGLLAPALASMVDRGVDMTLFQEAWFGLVLKAYSVLAVGALVGSLVSGFLAERFRRVRPIQLSSLGFVGGCLCIALCNASLDRLLRLCSGVQLAITLDVLVAFVHGKWLDWLAPALLCTVGTVLVAVSMAFAIEYPPGWLVTHGRRDRALDALRLLYGPKYCAEAECLTNGAILLRQPAGVGDRRQRNFSLPLAYTLLLKFFPTVQRHQRYHLLRCEDIRVARFEISAADCTIMMSVVRVISSLAASLLVDSMGRRGLVLVSSLIVMASLKASGFFYYKDMDNEEFRHRYFYVPLASLTTHIATSCLGPLPSVVMGEIPTPRAYSLFPGVSTAFCFFCELLITKEFQDFARYSTFPFSSGCSCWPLFAGHLRLHVHSRDQGEVSRIHQSGIREPSGVRF
nr:facilitated trehalose transporter Tret1-like [Dermacentor andersoni]